ncbi:MAG: OadG family protein [Clostridia bacterium]|nr:OadG family protein [Clostridia bacterium]
MENIKGEMLPVGTALVDSVLGYLVVFIGLALLMVVIILVGKIMVSRTRRSIEKTTAALASAPAAAAPAPVPQAEKKLAPGSAGEVKLYDTDPRDAAMIMAIVANRLQKPLNELRFVSIKEVKKDEV